MRALIAAAVLLTSALPALPARAGLLELFIRPHVTNFPECHDQRVLNTIVDRFNDAERRTWHRGLFMADMRNGRERFKRTGPRVGAHPVRRDHGGLQHGRQIPRRYCTGTALIQRTDPREHHGDKLLSKLGKVFDKLKHRDSISVHGYGGTPKERYPSFVRTQVLYLIEQGQGFAGTHHKVFFCIDGLDPWRVYDGHCRVLTRAN